MELLTEEEQWERLKAWLRTNGPSILIMVAVMVLAWFGWKWWQERGDRQAAAAAAAYESALNAFDADKITEGLALIETLRAEYPDSPYVSAADLIAVRVLVGRNELDKAVERLERVMNTARDEKLRPVARVRLARVLSAQAQYDRALEVLGTADLGEHEAARLETRGDVLYAKGDHAGALKEYEAAQARLPAATPQSVAEGVGEVLGLKIADLRAEVAGAALTPPTATPAAPAQPAPAAAPQAATP